MILIHICLMIEATLNEIKVLNDMMYYVDTDLMSVSWIFSLFLLLIFLIFPKPSSSACYVATTMMITSTYLPR